MNEEQQQKIDAQLEKGNRNPDTFRPRIVESSDAPVLSEAWLLEQDSDSVIVEVYLIGGKNLELEPFQVEVARGLTLMQTLAIQEAMAAYPLDPKLLNPAYTPNKAESAELEKRHDIRRRATIAQAIVNPEFSYNGDGDGIAIEARSEALVATLYDAYQVVNIPGKQAQFLKRFQDVGGDNRKSADGESASDS